MPTENPTLGRRPLTTRNARWAQAVAARLARWGVSANAISLTSIIFAGLAAWGLWTWTWFPEWTGIAVLIGAAAAIQGRLLCNLFDGMVAIEGGKRSPVGGLYNEVPDRIADSLILVAAGYGLPHMPYAEALGWGSGLLAMLTAYVRAVGGSLGFPACFHGPMAKQHRMFLLTMGCLATAACLHMDWVKWILWTILLVIAVGSVLTSYRRLLAIAAFLRKSP